MEFDYERQESESTPCWQEAIVHRTRDRIYTRYHAIIGGEEQWSDYCNIYYFDNPPNQSVPLSRVGLPEDVPTEWEDVHPCTNYKGLEAYYKAYEYMDDAGVIGLSIGLPGLSIKHPESIYEYYDNREQVIARCKRDHNLILHRVREMIKLKPDFILIGVSGHMLSNPEPIFRELSLPALKDVTSICKEAGIPSQIHCCGPEYALVKIASEETDLSSINPLETPPMGDCNLAVLKKEFGKKISLMGNLHTTDIMLRGSLKDIERAVKQAIDDAAEGGGFILSTGDQCGRDTPDENIFAMIESAKMYGKY